MGTSGPERLEGRRLRERFLTFLVVRRSPPWSLDEKVWWRKKDWRNIMEKADNVDAEAVTGPVDENCFNVELKALIGQEETIEIETSLGTLLQCHRYTSHSSSQSHQHTQPRSFHYYYFVCTCRHRHLEAEL